MKINKLVLSLFVSCILFLGFSPTAVGANWQKVIDLKEGQYIKTIDGWEKIKSIELLPPEPVWDISIFGTHNFLGNGIVAHNTSVPTPITSGRVTVESGKTYMQYNPATKNWELLETAGRKYFNASLEKPIAIYDTTLPLPVLPKQGYLHVIDADGKKVSGVSAIRIEDDGTFNFDLAKLEEGQQLAVVEKVAEGRAIFRPLKRADLEKLAIRPADNNWRQYALTIPDPGPGQNQTKAAASFADSMAGNDDIADLYQTKAQTRLAAMPAKELDRGVRVVRHDGTIETVNDASGIANDGTQIIAVLDSPEVRAHQQAGFWDKFRVRSNERGVTRENVQFEIDKKNTLQLIADSGDDPNVILALNQKAQTKLALYPEAKQIMFNGELVGVSVGESLEAVHLTKVAGNSPVKAVARIEYGFEAPSVMSAVRDEYITAKVALITIGDKQRPQDPIALLEQMRKLQSDLLAKFDDEVAKVKAKMPNGAVRDEVEAYFKSQREWVEKTLMPSFDPKGQEFHPIGQFAFGKPIFGGATGGQFLGVGGEVVPIKTGVASPYSAFNFDWKINGDKVIFRNTNKSGVKGKDFEFKFLRSDGVEEKFVVKAGKDKTVPDHLIGRPIVASNIKLSEGVIVPIRETRFTLGIKDNPRLSWDISAPWDGGELAGRPRNLFARTERALFDGGQSTGMAWFDQYKLENRGNADLALEQFADECPNCWVIIDGKTVRRANAVAMADAGKVTGFLPEHAVTIDGNQAKFSAGNFDDRINTKTFAQRQSEWGLKGPEIDKFVKDIEPSLDQKVSLGLQALVDARLSYPSVTAPLVDARFIARNILEEYVPVGITNRDDILDGLTVDFVKGRFLAYEDGGAVKVRYLNEKYWDLNARVRAFIEGRTKTDFIVPLTDDEIAELRDGGIFSPPLTTDEIKWLKLTKNPFIRVKADTIKAKLIEPPNFKVTGVGNSIDAAYAGSLEKYVFKNLTELPSAPVEDPLGNLKLKVNPITGESKLFFNDDFPNKRYIVWLWADQKGQIGAHSPDAVRGAELLQDVSISLTDTRKRPPPALSIAMAKSYDEIDALVWPNETNVPLEVGRVSPRYTNEKYINLKEANLSDDTIEQLLELGYVRLRSRDEIVDYYSEFDLIRRTEEKYRKNALAILRANGIKIKPTENSKLFEVESPLLKTLPRDINNVIGSLDMEFLNALVGRASISFPNGYKISLAGDKSALGALKYVIGLAKGVVWDIPVNTAKVFMWRPIEYLLGRKTLTGARVGFPTEAEKPATVPGKVVRSLQSIILIPAGIFAGTTVLFNTPGSIPIINQIPIIGDKSIKGILFGNPTRDPGLFSDWYFKNDPCGKYNWANLRGASSWKTSVGVIDTIGWVVGGLAGLVPANSIPVGFGEIIFPYPGTCDKGQSGSQQQNSSKPPTSGTGAGANQLPTPAKK